MLVAYEYRKKFKKDVVIDLIGYRRFGHNELDQPSFTQPLMYDIINKMKPVCALYQEQLLKEKVIDETLIKTMTEKFNTRLASALETSKNPSEVSKWLP